MISLECTNPDGILWHYGVANYSNRHFCLFRGRDYRLFYRSIRFLDNFVLYMYIYYVNPFI